MLKQGSRQNPKPPGCRQNAQSRLFASLAVSMRLRYGGTERKRKEIGPASLLPGVWVSAQGKELKTLTMRNIVKESPGREISLSALAMLLVGLAWAFGALIPLDRPVGDILIRLPSPRSQGEGPFAAVLIDDRAIDRFGPMPWPREQLAALMVGMRHLGARGVVVDILLPEPGFEPADFRLAQMFGDGPTVLAATLNPDGEWILPAEIFGGIQNAAHINAEIEGDGVIRTFSYTKQAGNISLEAISIVAARLAGWEGKSRPGLVFRPDFLQRPMEIPHLSAADVLDPNIRDARLEGRIVFLGVSATGSTDQFITPVSQWHRPTPGVLVHAGAASSVLRGGLLQPIRSWSAFIAAFLAALSIQALRSGAGRLKIRHLVIVALTIVAGSLVSLWALQIILPIVGLLLATMLSAFFREVVESRNIQAETGNILQSLVKEGRSEHQSPRGPHERLRLARLLQERIIHDRNLRRTLLEGLGEGVILWDGEGRPLLSNSSFGLFWGEIPTLPEMLHTLGSAGIEPRSDRNTSAHLEHLNRSLEIHFQDLGDGHLAVVRDRSAERELDRRRRDMQRLVSHELKTPLASLAGFGSLLERYSLTDEELRHTAGLIRSEAERLGEMVRTFLDLERLGAGYSNEDRVQVDLIPLIEERCEILSAVSKEKAIELEVKVNGPAVISGVPQLLAQVVDNLIGNAVKFSPEDTKVRIEIGQVQDTIALSVSDSGPGIPPEALPHLFERFFRVPGSGTQGSGLGLALVREVVEHHQATVGVESTVGTGSTFTVKFPRPEGPEDA